MERQDWDALREANANRSLWTSKSWSLGWLIYWHNQLSSLCRIYFGFNQLTLLGAGLRNENISHLCQPWMGQIFGKAFFIFVSCRIRKLNPKTKPGSTDVKCFSCHVWNPLLGYEINAHNDETKQNQSIVCIQLRWSCLGPCAVEFWISVRMEMSWLLLGKLFQYFTRPWVNTLVFCSYLTGNSVAACLLSLGLSQCLVLC